MFRALSWSLCLVSGWFMQAQAPAAATRAIAVQAAAERRVALVIGNDSYQHVQQLQNARADARVIAGCLERTGFQVTLRLDLDERAMQEAIRGFKTRLAGGDVAVFYFSGHGVQLGGANYLLPTDIHSESEDQVKDEAVPLQRVLDDLQEQKARFSLAIVDACRDNPFRQPGRSIGGRGLAPTTAATGQMVLFSAGAGQQALDSLGPQDRNPNGLFTRVLIREMVRPGVPVERVLRNVREEVVKLARANGHEQVPALYDQALVEFYFIPGDRAGAEPPIQGPAVPVAPVPVASLPSAPPDPGFVTLPGLSPAGWWKFDEASGAVAKDSSGGGHAGALLNAPIWAARPAGGALSFSGNAMVSLPGPLPLAEAWTITAWFQSPLPRTGQWHTLTRGTNDHQILVGPDQVSLGSFDNAAGTGFHDSLFRLDTLAAGWHHLAAVGSGGNTVFHVDGRRVGAIAWQSTSDVAVIGNFQGGAQAFGTVADVRVYNSALSDGQIAAIAGGTAPGPVGWWKCDEGGGTAVADRSGKGCTGMLVNGPAWVRGEAGEALSFSGDAMVILPTAVPLAPLWTIGAWIQVPLPNTGAWHTLTRGTNDHQILVAPDQVSLGSYDNAGATGFHDCGFRMNTLTPGWHHVAAAGSAGRTLFYVDGRPAGTIAWQSASNVLAFGNIQIGAQPFGTLRDVRIYDTALTAAQITAIVSGSAP